MLVVMNDQPVALVGSPNSGKTTLFNWLTGSRFKTVNYPGATVDYSLGSTLERFGAAVTVMDTPGTYSLDPKSPEEVVTLKALFEHPQHGTAKVVVAVVDATQLSRHLLLFKQLQEVGFRLVVALTMSDLIHQRGDRVQLALLRERLGVPVIEIDGRLGGGVEQLVQAIRTEMTQPTEVPRQRPTPWSSEKIEATLSEARKTEGQVVQPAAQPLAKKQDARRRTQELDRFFLHPVMGLLFFTALMTVLFTSIYWAATPLMDLVDALFSWAGEQVLAWAPGALWSDFVANGIFASFGAVLVFVPQIFILFLGVVALEDSGYLARAATLVDKPLSKLGLGGRSFVPLLSGYACAVPAMMAARTINSRKERWLTLFILPLMSCSARLPVYALLLGFLFVGEAAWKAGLMLTGLYLGSLVIGALAAAILNRFLPKNETSFFMLELPVYRQPHLWHVVRSAYNRTLAYVKRAGPVIFVLALVIWGAITFPRYDLENASERLQHSYAARLGQVIEPVFTPMGVDWRVGVGLISAFAAREVFVSSLAVVFNVTETDDEATMQETLLEKMRTAQMPDGTPIFTWATVMGLMVFFMIALQCLSTVAIAAREFGSWKMALLQLATFNLVAYGLAVAIVQLF